MKTTAQFGEPGATRAMDVDGLGRRRVHACSLNGVCKSPSKALAVTTPCVVPGRWRVCNR